MAAQKAAYFRGFHLILQSSSSFPRRLRCLQPSLARAISASCYDPSPIIHEAIDEETIPNYSPNDYYSTHPGQLLNDRYQAITKLGWGFGSTVWLAEDLRRCKEGLESPRYVAVKIGTCTSGSIATPEHELTRANLKDDNVLVDLENDSVLEDFVQQQRRTPLPRHVMDDGHITYQSQSGFGPLRDYFILPEIADLDLAQSGEGSIRIHPIQPHRYRAPEVILGTGWSYSADIWNMGVLIWNMMEGKDLFTNLQDEQGHYNVHAHLAQMIALLGPPPTALLRRERSFRKLTFAPEVQNPKGQPCRNAVQYFGGPFFDDNGEFIRKDLIPRDVRIAETVTLFQGEEKQQFLDFVSKMLQWEPEKRSTAKDLLKDPFLQLEDEAD